MAPTPSRIEVQPTRFPYPIKLLDTTKSNRKTRLIDISNDNNSTFLRVPREIRDGIYKLVFGGMTVHILGSLGLKTGMPGHVDFFDELLSVLHVGRQVHREAALLPYQLNRFLSSPSLAALPETLAPQQLAAIRSIYLILVDDFHLDPSERRAIADMTGLRDLEVSILIRSYGAHESEPPGVNPDHALLHRAGRNKFFDGFLVLQQREMTFRTVKVDVQPTPLLAEKQRKEGGSRIEAMLSKGKSGGNEGSV